METSALFTVALGIVLFALVSRRAEAGPVTAPMVFTAFGFVMGGAVLGMFEPSLQSEGIQALAKITLVVALFTDAARIDLRRLGREHDLPLRLLGIGLPLTLIAGTGLAMLLFPALNLWSAALIGVILAPTDAALGQAVVSDRRVPQRVRQALNVESGLNDGLAFPALLFVASLAGAGAVADLGVGGGDTGAADWTVFITKRATNAIRGSKRPTSSSSTKIAPAPGELKAVARPAPAPPAISALRSFVSRRKNPPMTCAAVTPICTLGPSRPKARPLPMARTPPANLTGISRAGAGASEPWSTAST